MRRSQSAEERKDGLRILGSDESKVMRKTEEVHCAAMFELITMNI